MTARTQVTATPSEPGTQLTKPNPLLDARPRADVLENAAAYRLAVELPGVTADTLELQVEDGVLEVVGTRERLGTTIRYARSFGLPDVIDVDGISAELTRGVLTVTLPKHATARPRRIPITTAA